ncbi:MAG: glycosyltransferase [Acidobacteriota bacterium]|nr:glycosyltransferase [Acidobacteriota bacterium]
MRIAKRAETSRPRVLIVTCGFIPQASPHAVFWAPAAGYLAEAGADVRVLTLSERDLLALTPPDWDLSRSMSPLVPVERIGGSILRGLVRKRSVRGERLRKVKANPLAQLLFPDPYMDCIIPLIRRGLEITRSWRPAVVLSVAYPWSAHLAGWCLAGMRRARWVAYYGDPWIQNPASDLPRAGWRRPVDACLEKMLLRKAARVMVTTEKTKSLYEETFPFLGRKVDVLRFGYSSPGRAEDEPADIRDIRAPGDRRIWIVHTGRIYRGARSPEPLLRALVKLRGQNPGAEAGILVCLVGEVDGETREQIESWGLGSTVRLVPWVPQCEMRRWFKAADWLLLLGNRGGLQVPSKVYDYLGARKPVLMLEEWPEDETSMIIRDVDAGWIVKNTAESIATFLRSALAGGLRAPSYSGRRAAGDFAREAEFEHCRRIILDCLDDGFPG